MSQAEVLSEGSGEEHASRLIQVGGKIQFPAGLSLYVWHLPTDYMPPDLLKTYPPHTPPVVPDILLSSSSLIYEKERTSRTSR